MNLGTAKQAAVRAARAAGEVMRRNLSSVKRANAVWHHDIKLELDVRCQKLIERMLQSRFPGIGVLGEEGVTGDLRGEYRWVVDPIDGTVNFAYSIPHACVSIALQRRVTSAPERRDSVLREPRRSQSSSRSSRRDFLSEDSLHYPDGYRTVVGVVYDPFGDELWTAAMGQPARLNGKVIRASRRKLNEAIVSFGFAKNLRNLEATLLYLNRLVYQVRKIRVMGSAALSLAYVATGRFDAYLERGIRLWDIAAGGLILECAGGDFRRLPIRGKQAYWVVAANGPLRGKLRVAAV